MKVNHNEFVAAKVIITSELFGIGSIFPSQYFIIYNLYNILVLESIGCWLFIKN